MERALFYLGKGMKKEAGIVDGILSYVEGVHSARNPVDRPKLVLKDARRCMESAERMTSQRTSTPLQFNLKQCEHLANKLKEAVHSAENLVTKSSALGRIGPRTGVFVIAVIELLSRSAKEVESFIHAMGLGNTSEYVRQLCFNLELCTEFCEFGPGMHCDSFEEAWRAMTAFESIARSISESVNERVAPVLSDDQCTLLKLEDFFNRCMELSDQESELPKSLLSRLTQCLESGSVQLSPSETQYSSLKSGQRLGAGSFGEVRKSSWLGSDVAEKMFIGPDPPTFMDEVKSMAGLNHPNIVSLLGFAVDKNQCSIIMELMDGDLTSLMRERKGVHKVPFTIFEAVDLMLQSAEGMHYLHEIRLVHRDLKAQNILVKRRKDFGNEYVYAKVADFGLSRTKVSSSSYSILTLNTATTRWMAAELMPRSEHIILMSTDSGDRKNPVDVYSVWHGML